MANKWLIKLKTSNDPAELSGTKVVLNEYKKYKNAEDELEGIAPTVYRYLEATTPRGLKYSTSETTSSDIEFLFKKLIEILPLIPGTGKNLSYEEFKTYYDFAEDSVERKSGIYVIKYDFQVRKNYSKNFNDFENEEYDTLKDQIINAISGYSKQKRGISDRTNDSSSEHFDIDVEIETDILDEYNNNNSPKIIIIDLIKSIIKSISDVFTKNDAPFQITKDLEDSSINFYVRNAGGYLVRFEMGKEESIPQESADKKENLTRENINVIWKQKYINDEVYYRSFGNSVSKSLNTSKQESYDNAQYNIKVDNSISNNAKLNNIKILEEKDFILENGDIDYWTSIEIKISDIQESSEDDGIKSEPTSEQSTSQTQEETQDKKDNVEQVTPGTTNKFKPTIKVDPISFTVDGPKHVQEEVANGLGNFPFVWYNAYQIEPRDIISFSLSNESFLPKLKMTFNDSQNLMSDKGFPLDDSRMKIFINSRDENLKPIFMQFKIVSFSINKGGSYNIEGLADIPKLYLTKFESFSKMTSYEVLEKIARECGLGLNSNTENTDDRMTWINPSMARWKFITEQVLQRCYKSDESFMWCYVDFYYNLNYIDVSKELDREVVDQKGIGNTGLKSAGGSKSGSDVQSLFLTNDASMKDNNNYFDKYKIINNSTRVSLNKGYRHQVKFYDMLKKDFLIFEIDSITSQGDKTIILKGAPGDEEFYKEHVVNTYVGRMDTDNVHKNFHYSYIQNGQNIEDLTKIGLSISLPTPNYNLWRFQKVKVFISNQAPTPSVNMINYRLSGDWMVVNIKTTMVGGKMTQDVLLVKRELELSPDEMNNEKNNAKSDTSNKPPQDSTNGDGTNENPSVPTEQSVEPEAPVSTSNVSKNLKGQVFKNYADIDKFFQQYGSSGFIDWFTKKHAKQKSFGNVHGHAAVSITKPKNWNSVWGNIKTIFGKDGINFYEFLAINTIMLNETGGSFAPLSESVGSKNSPGISYAFNSGGKRSYNTLTDAGNKNAKVLFNDPKYKSAHGLKPFGNILKDTTDVRWSSEKFPLGFSGGDINNEVNKSGKTNTFISEADFFKFRGRGFIQTTGRSNYEPIVKFVKSYSGNNPTILKYKNNWSNISSNDEILSISTNADWDDLFFNTDTIVACYAVYIHGKAGSYLNISDTQSDSGLRDSFLKVAKKIAGAKASKYHNLYLDRVYQQIESLGG